MEKIQVTLEKTEDGYWAHSNYISRCISFGHDLDKVKENMNKAVKFHLERLREDSEPIPHKLEGEYELIFKLD